MKELTLEKQQKADMVAALRDFLSDELDLDIGALQVEMLVDHLAEVVGPVFYNQGLKDAQAVLLRRIDDVTADIEVLEKLLPKR